MKKFNEKNAMKFLKKICSASKYLDPSIFTYHLDNKAKMEFYLENSRNRLRIFIYEILKYLDNNSEFNVLFYPIKLPLLKNIKRDPLNCLAIKRGKINKEIWITGHHDYCAALGAEDNAAALAIIMELARCLKDEKLNHTLCFASFDLEERSAAGSTNMAANFERARRLENIEYLINLDCVASGKQIIIAKDVSGTVSDEGLCSLLISSAEKRGYEFIKRYNCSWTADHTPFARRGVKTTQLSSANDWNNYINHTKNDIPKNIRLENLKMVGEVLLNAIKILDKEV